MAVATTVEQDTQKWVESIIGMPEAEAREAERKIEWMKIEMVRLNALTEASKREAEHYATEAESALQKLKADLGIA
jgi:hypothetical protein